VISTVRGLVIACAIAALLVALAIATGGRDAPPADRVLVPGFAADAVTELAWKRDGAPPIRLARDPASPTGWSGADPRGAADPGAIGDALAALRGGRWHRRGPAAAAGRIAATLAVTGAGGKGLLIVGIGEPLPGGEQTWLGIGDHGYLVDAWLARALAPAPLALRVRRPLAAIAAASQVQLSPVGDLGEVSLADAPRRVTAPFSLLLDPIAAAALERPLAELEVIELPRAPLAPPAGGLTIVADRTTVRDAGPCPGSPGRRAIDGTAGPGCVDEAAGEGARRALETLTGPLAQLALRRPVPLEPVKIVLRDGAVLDLAGRPRIGDRHDADPVAVAELIAALGAPAEPVALPAGPPRGTLSVTDPGGQSIALELHLPDVVVRRGEPVGLRVGEGAFRRLVQASEDLRDRTPWREEPTTVVALELDGTTYTRGAVIGEWTRAGPGRDDPATVEELVGALAAIEVSPHPPGDPPRHVVTLHVRPPGGAPVTRTIRIGDPGPTCRASTGGSSLAIAPEICARVRALAP
jgi:hypothetical protein